MHSRIEPGARGRRGRYLFAALVIAVLVGLGVAVPVLANDGPVQIQVVGGDPVPNGKYPFMTSIQRDTSKSDGYREHYCGGTLIDRNSVLTAAHCVEDIGPRTFRELRIVVGVTVLSSDQGQARRIDRLSDIDIHPDFNRRTSEYDAAVIKLGRPVKRIAPIALAEPDESGDHLENPPGTATVTGWGNMQPGYPKRMQEAQLPLVSDASCESSYGRVFYPALMLCAGDGETDACYGDSGGPMFVEDPDGVRRQIGITSWGKGCAEPGFPGVYTEVNAEPIHSFIVRAASH